jgi:hypothetical protein
LHEAFAFAIAACLIAAAASLMRGGTYHDETEPESAVSAPPRAPATPSPIA